MSDELPPVDLLDMAAKAADGSDWNRERSHYESGLTAFRESVIAHARTLETLREAMRLLRACDQDDDLNYNEVRAFLAKHEPDIVPVDPDEELVCAIINAFETGGQGSWYGDFPKRGHRESFDRALAELKRIKGGAA